MTPKRWSKKFLNSGYLSALFLIKNEVAGLKREVFGLHKNIVLRRYLQLNLPDNE